MYEPPKYENQPLRPAEVGTLVDEKLDPRDISFYHCRSSGQRVYRRIEEKKEEGLIFDRTDYYLKS